MDKKIKIKKKCSLDSKKIMSNGSKSFFAASRLFPKRLRGPATVIYSYCRLADDLVDFGGGQKAINDLKKRLTMIYSGHPSNLGVDREFSKVVLKYKIPKKLPEALIEGFEWDINAKEYNTIEELNDYAARVAGTVGGMIAVLMGVKDPKILRSACQLGLAMQLTNIARDVGEDAKNNRLYLPKNWLIEKGIDPNNWKKNPIFSKEIADVTEKLLKVAERLYKHSSVAIYSLPRDCRASIFSARYIYSEIGNKIKCNSYNTVDQRAIVSFSKKINLIFKSFHSLIIPKNLLISNFEHNEQKLNSYQSIEFLVRSITTTKSKSRCSTQALSFFQRLHWVIELFLKLEERNKSQFINPRLNSEKKIEKEFSKTIVKPLSFFQRINWVFELFLKLEERNKSQLINPRHSPR